MESSSSYFLTNASITNEERQGLNLTSSGKQKESLLTTKTSQCTKEIFDQASALITLMTSTKNIEQENLKALHQASKELIFKINDLFNANRVPSFQISEIDSHKKKDMRIEISLVRDVCKNIINLCYETDRGELYSKNLKVKWSQKELNYLKNYSKTFISNVNLFLQGASLPSLILNKKVEKFADKVKDKVYGYKLYCTFKNEEEQKQWEKVREKVEAYFSKNILLDLNHFEDGYNRILDIEPICSLLAHRLLLKARKHDRENVAEKKDIQRDLDRNTISILGAHYIKLLQFIKALKTPSPLHALDKENQEHIKALKEIFKDCFKNKYTEEMSSTFFLAIADSLKIHYLEREIEPFTVEKIKKMLAKWKKNEEVNIPLDYATLENSHLERLRKSTTVDMGEMERALSAACIWIRNKETKAILLFPPEKSKPNEEPAEKKKKIDHYLPKTEQLISQCIKDPYGTILTNFREIAWEILQKQKSQTNEIKEDKISILSMDEQIFNVFAPVMKKIESKQPLSAEEEGLLVYVENILKEKNPEVIMRHGLKKIARLLFSFHRILNQPFIIGTLSVLKAVLYYIDPTDRKGITSIDSLENSSSVFVDLGDNEDIALEWQMTNKLYSDNWLFTQILRIELPPMGSDEIKGKVTPEFKFTPSKRSVSSLDSINDKAKNLLEEELEILIRIFVIRCALKAMEFPLNSFNKEV
jgi:hypothetical protein